MADTTVVSSPGKVLIAGGYLVLDPVYSGVVVSTSSRFYTIIRDGARGPFQVRVRSPQFVNAIWDYSVNVDGVLGVVSDASDGKNKFVELALQNSIALAAEIKGSAAVKEKLSKGVDIYIAGDNDFYSQRAKLQSLHLPRTLASLSKIPPFNPLNVSLSDVEKTGLGSSAALITSLIAALLLHLDAIPATALSDDTSEGRNLVHNLAQFVHCLAQGKVGSGFDVSSAVYGSQLYTRFDPSVLQNVMNETSSHSQPLLPTLQPSNKFWNHRVQPFKLPPLTRIMLADVGAGSNTPSLVGKVLKWRKDESAKAYALWTSLDQLNQSLAQTLLFLSTLYEQDASSYEATVKYISCLQPLQWTAYPGFTPNERKVVESFYEVHEISQSIRLKMREMGDASGVPIEPPEQTALLDLCVTQAGVIGGGVPGAGGYDAIWLLLCEPADCSPALPPYERIEHLWNAYTELEVSPLSAVESAAKGARVESIEAVPGLQTVIAEA